MPELNITGILNGYDNSTISKFAISAIHHGNTYLPTLNVEKKG